MTNKILIEIINANLNREGYNFKYQLFELPKSNFKIIYNITGILYGSDLRNLINEICNFHCVFTIQSIEKNITALNIDYIRN